MAIGSEVSIGTASCKRYLFVTSVSDGGMRSGSLWLPSSISITIPRRAAVRSAVRLWVIAIVIDRSVEDKGGHFTVLLHAVFFQWHSIEFQFSALVHQSDQPRIDSQVIGHFSSEVFHDCLLFIDRVCRKIDYEGGGHTPNVDSVRGIWILVIYFVGFRSPAVLSINVIISPYVLEVAAQVSRGAVGEV